MSERTPEYDAPQSSTGTNREKRMTVRHVRPHFQSDYEKMEAALKIAQTLFRVFSQKPQ